MKERPILMSAPMVRAILFDRKTQTRRVMKRPFMGNPIFDPITKFWWYSTASKKCPYGLVGDRLWVRETWSNDGLSPDEFYYRATPYGLTQEEVANIKWKPSIHMFRRACRIVLEITEIRVERLKDISEGDAIAEGIDWSPLDGSYNCSGKWRNNSIPIYARLWERINGVGSWDKNPLVWVVCFKVVT